eukprot:scaffold10954_cov267-Chaetoceros_neogracile.AAC.5
MASFKSISEIIIDNVKCNKNNCVPIETFMLDFEYIQQCSSISILVDILQHLAKDFPRCYPDLVDSLEKKILSILPEDTRRKCLLLSENHNENKNVKYASEEDTVTIMENWIETMTLVEGKSSDSASKDKSCRILLPPVRKSAMQTVIGASQIETHAISSNTSSPKNLETKEPKKLTARICKENLSNRDYFRAWDNFDVDQAEIEIDSSDEIDCERRDRSPLIEEIESKDVQKGEILADSYHGISTEDLQQKLGVDDLNASERAFMARSEKEKGSDHFRSKEFEAAIQCYSKSIALDPSNAVVYSNRAMALIRVSDLPRALDDCNQALAIDPTYTKALARRGTIHKQCRRYLEAMNDFATCVIQEPGNKEYITLWQKSKKVNNEASADTNGNSNHELKRRIVIEDESDDDEEIEEVYTPGSLNMR